MEFIFDMPLCPSVAIDSDKRRFPVRRIFCVGRNYAAHAREMGKDPERDPPFFFTKPADAVVDSGTTIPYPTLTKNLHHEIELVVAIGREGFQVDRHAAPSLIWGYGVGIDLTRRDLQEDAKATGRPWDWSKGFDRSAPCSPLVPADRSAPDARSRIWLSVNGTARQDATLSELIWSVEEIVATCSDAVRLMPGDLIFTGTPAGVGPLVPGDGVEGGIDGVGQIAITIGQPE
jgi:fumarylpyruvate hydrolase